MQSFIFGPGTQNPTYEELQRRRAMIDALSQQSTERMPSTFGEGLSAIGTAIASRIADKRLSEKEAAERERVGGRFTDIAKRLMGGGSPSPSPASFASSPASFAQPTPNPQGLPPEIIDAVDRMDPQDGRPSPDAMRRYLLQKGMPEHIADGFLKNFQDESGFDPGINEIAPLVPGSRGGFGLAQWTGPRRVALEQFASERGKPVSDWKTQLDFLDSELRGPEYAAAQKIMGASDSGSAAAAVATHFLRPSKEHLDRRVAQYTGGQGGGMPDMDQISELAELAGNPYLSEGQRRMAQSLIEQQMARMQPPEPVRGMAVGGRLVNPQTGEVMYEPGPEDASRAAEYGLNPMFGVDAQGNPVVMQLNKQGQAAQTQLPAGVTLSREPEKLDVGTSFILLDPITRQVIGQIPKDLEGAAAATARGGAAGKAGAEAIAELPTAIAKAEDAMNLIDSIMNDPALPGITGMIQGRLPPMTQAGTDLLPKIEQLQGKAFLEAFESLKGGGQITEIEGQKATQAMARLQRAQSDKAYREALADLRDIIARGADRARAKAGAPSAVPGLSDDDLLQQYGGN